jgi:hypothetical protein
MLTILFVSAQVSLPEWVRGRGLAIFLTAYFGAMTFGSAVWGEVASSLGVPFALAAAGACAFIAMPFTWRWKLQTGASQNLAPSMRWRAPCFLNRVADDDGPILAIKEYAIAPQDRPAFLVMMQEVGLERKRDGGYAWNVFEDPDDAGKVVETFLIHSALELKYRESRVTMADQMLFDQVRQFLKAPPETRYLIAPKRNRHARRKGAEAARLNAQPGVRG